MKQWAIIKPSGILVPGSVRSTKPEAIGTLADPSHITWAGYYRPRGFQAVRVTVTKNEKEKTPRRGTAKRPRRRQS
jgi:hypothetical protein